MADAYVEMGDIKLTLEEYENMTVLEDSGTIVSEMMTTSGPGMNDFYMLVFIQLQRIYDLLALDISLRDDPHANPRKALAEVVALHQAGKFAAPVPNLDQGE